MRPNAVREILPGQLVQWNREGRPYALVDVREDDEVRYVAIPGALHVPMAQIPERAEELPKDRPLVVMCHVGGRSARVAYFLAQRGFEDVYNLEGGIDAWAADVDPSLPRY